MVWLDLSEKEPGAWPALITLIVGVGFVKVGLAAIVIVGSTRHRFDRPTGRVVVRTRSLRGISKVEIPLAHIADVVLETSTTDWPRGPTVTDYRLAYVLRSGEHVPWTVYLNGTRADKMVFLYAARAFLRRAAARGAPASEELVSSNGAMKRMGSATPSHERKEAG